MVGIPSLKLSLNVNHTETPACNICKNSGIAAVLKTSSLILCNYSIICTIVHKKSFEALDRTLKDFRENDRPMNKVLLVFGGDFR